MSEVEQLQAFDTVGHEVASAIGITFEVEPAKYPLITVESDGQGQYELDGQDYIEIVSKGGKLTRREREVSALYPLPFRHAMNHEPSFFAREKSEAGDRTKVRGFAAFCGMSAVSGVAKDYLYVVENYHDILLSSHLIPVKSIARILLHDKRERDYMVQYQGATTQDYRVPLLVRDGVTILDRAMTDDEEVGFLEQFAKLPKTTVYEPRRK